MSESSLPNDNSQTTEMETLYFHKHAGWVRHILYLSLLQKRFRKSIPYTFFDHRQLKIPIRNNACTIVINVKVRLVEIISDVIATLAFTSCNAFVTASLLNVYDFISSDVLLTPFKHALAIDGLHSWNDGKYDEPVLGYGFHPRSKIKI